jgi:hypothetical protein
VPTVIGGITETLILTTGYNSAGSAVTGTITEGPTTTTSAIVGLTTYSTFPPGISWSTTSVATNTHDSSGDPVIGPWPGCWFCPPGSNGIVLFGWPGPGVYGGGGRVFPCHLFFFLFYFFFFSKLLTRRQTSCRTSDSVPTTHDRTER